MRHKMLRRYIRAGIQPDSMLESIRRCRPFRREISNMQCAYLSTGRRDFGGVMRALGQRDMIIGTMENYSAFFDTLSGLLGWADVLPVTVNRSQEDYAEHYMADEELLALIHELNQEDTRLLEHVSALPGEVLVNIAKPEARQERLRQLPLKPWMRSDARARWKQIASDYWPAKSSVNAPLDYRQISVFRDAGVLCAIPPGKSRSLVQRWLIRAAAVPHSEALLALGAERVIQKFDTGLALSDWSDACIAQLLADEQMFRFALLHDPVDRLLDVYLDVFVARRSTLRHSPRLAACIASVQGRTEADLDRGISFREFAGYLLQQQPDEMHELWRPQCHAVDLLGPDVRLYRPDQLMILSADLLAQKGIQSAPTGVARAMRLIPASSGREPALSGKYADVMPADLPDQLVDCREQLLDATLLTQLRQKYERDCLLYTTIATAEQEQLQP